MEDANEKKRLQQIQGRFNQSNKAAQHNFFTTLFDEIQ